MNRWIGRVAPPPLLFALWFFEALLIGFNLAFIYLENYDPGLMPMRKQSILFGQSVLLLGYLGFRFYATHPLVQPAYRAWLAGTPWRPGMPLPLGPIHLVVQDVFVLLTFALPGYAVVGVAAILPPLIFLGAYQLGLAYFFLFYEPRRLGYAQLFLALAIAPGYCHSPALAAAVALAGYAFGIRALRSHMALYPWPPRRPTSTGRRFWPPAFQQAGPFWESDYLSRFDGVIIGLLAGWLAFCVTAVSELFLTRYELDTQMQMVITSAACTAVFVKLLIYLPGYAPPLSWWARLATGRFLIPRYDAVYVGPIIALASGGLLVPVLRSLDVSPLLAYPASAAAGMIGLLCIGPTLMRWKLTAPVKLQLCLQGSWMSKVARMQMNAANAGRSK